MSLMQVAGAAHHINHADNDMVKHAVFWKHFVRSVKDVPATQT